MAVVAIKDLVTKFFKKNLSQETMPKLIKDSAALSIKKTPRKRSGTFSQVPLRLSDSLSRS